ncbi:MAG: hypothetical protein RH948_04075 [Cyclobacteriaceae bacterium]
MKILKENPLTRELHKFWRSKISKELNIDSSYLSSIHYVNETPKRFYLKEAFKAYLDFLVVADKTDHVLLQKVLNDSEQNLDNANNALNEINNIQIHDIIPPDSEIELIDFIDTKIHFNLLKLYESCLFGFLLVVAKYERIKHKKGIEGLDLYNAIDDLKKGPFAFVFLAYRGTVRNGIAHGKVVFKERDIHYSDKKGNSELVSSREIIKLFDHLIDINNGLSLALKTFMLSDVGYKRNSEFNIPKSILVEELKTICKTPGWEILNSFESLSIGNKKQLTIYIKNNNWDSSKVNWYCFFTAYWAEALTKGYERFFISLGSIHSLPGWAGFNGYKLKELRERDSNDLNEYYGALENGFIMFVPRFKFPRLIYKLGSFRNAFLILLSLNRQKQKEKSSNRIDVRDSYFHSKGSYLVIADSSVVLRSKLTEPEIVGFIEKNCRNIMNQSFRHTKNQLPFFSLQRFLPLKYARVFIYDSDMRIRNLRHSGLIPELIAAIEINYSRQIKTVNLINCQVEQKGKYKIFWHKNWRRKKN